MKKVQEDLMALQGQENPLDIIADEFKNRRMSFVLTSFLSLISRMR